MMNIKRYLLSWKRNFGATPISVARDRVRNSTVQKKRKESLKSLIDIKIKTGTRRST